MGRLYTVWSYSTDLPDRLVSQATVAVNDGDLEHVYVYGLVADADLMAPLTLIAAEEMAMALLTAVRSQRLAAQEGVPTDGESLADQGRG